MTRRWNIDVAEQWRQVRARFARTSDKPEELGSLRLSVSELGWQATLELPNEPPQTTAESWIDANVAVSATESIRRAVRAVSRNQRERIGTVRLAVADPAILIIDSRSARVRSTDPAVIAEIGCQELGAEAVLYGFIPFGQSSEHEVARGVYAFITLDQVKEYLVGLDTLAQQVVEIVPAPLLTLAGAETDSLAMIDFRAKSTTIVLADPDNGTVLCRELDCGRSDFATAVADATSVSAREAAEGLQRRVCFPPEAGSTDAAAPMTATERALTKLLRTFRAELADWLEHFVHHRLANAPLQVLVSGEVDRVRGLSEWIGHAFGVPTQGGVDLHRLFTELPTSAGWNLLQTAPVGILTIGKTSFRFVDGKFRSDQPRSARLPTTGGIKFPQRTLSIKPTRKLAWPAAAACIAVAALWFSISGSAAPLDQASATLAAAQMESQILRDALRQRARVGSPVANEENLAWSSKLVTLATALPDGIRIGKISASGTDPKSDDKLVIEGDAIAPNNLSEISAVIDRLANSPSFMRDVGAITFGGAVSGEGHTSDSLHFAINVSLLRHAKPGEQRNRSGR